MFIIIKQGPRFSPLNVKSKHVSAPKLVFRPPTESRTLFILAFILATINIQPTNSLMSLFLQYILMPDTFSSTHSSTTHPTKH